MMTVVGAAVGAVSGFDDGSGGIICRAMATAYSDVAVVEIVIDTAVSDVCQQW